MASSGKEVSGISSGSVSAHSASSSSAAQGPKYIYKHMPAGKFDDPAPGIIYVKEQGTGQLLFCYRGEDGKVVKLKVSGKVSGRVRSSAIERFSPEIQLQLRALLERLDPKLQPLEDFYEKVTISAIARAENRDEAKASAAAGARGVFTKRLKRATLESVDKPFEDEAIFLYELNVLADKQISGKISYSTEDGVTVASYSKSLDEHPEKIKNKLKRQKEIQKESATSSPEDSKVTVAGTYPIQGEEGSSEAISRRYPLQFNGQPMEFRAPYEHKLENNIEANRLETYLYSIGNNFILMEDQYKQYQSSVKGDPEMKGPITRMVNLLADIGKILYRNSDTNAFTDDFKMFDEEIRKNNLFLLTDKSLLRIEGKLSLLRDKHGELLKECNVFNKKTNSNLDLTFLRSNMSNLDKLIGVVDNIRSLHHHREFIRNGGLSSLDWDGLLQFKLELSLQRDQGQHFFNHEAILYSWDALIGVVEKNIVNYHKDRYDENVRQLNRIKDSEFIIRCRKLSREFDEIMQHSTASNADKQDAYGAVNIQLREILPKSEIRRISLSASLNERNSKIGKEQAIIHELESIVLSEKARGDNLLTVADTQETATEKGEEKERNSVPDNDSDSSKKGKEKEISDTDNDSDNEFYVDPNERPVLNKPLPSPVRVFSPDFFSESRRNAKIPSNPVLPDTTNNEKTGLGM